MGDGPASRREQLVFGFVADCDYRLLRGDRSMDELLKIFDDVSNVANWPSQAVVPLYPARDRGALETHFASLDGEDLRYRFCGFMKRTRVTQYLDQISETDAPFLRHLPCRSLGGGLPARAIRGRS